MQTSPFSFIMSLLWCSVFLLLAVCLRRKTNFVLKYGVSFILIALIVGILRLFFPIEPHFAVVVHATSILPVFQLFLMNEMFQIRGIPINIFDAFLSIWVLGSVLYLVCLIFKLHKDKIRVEILSSRFDPQAQRIMNEIVLGSRPKQKYRIIISEDVKSPMMTGFFTPTILLPELSLSDEEMRFVLLHEWNHFLYKHLWIKLFFNMLCALLWWNPLVYLVKKDLDYVLEVSCDRLVVKDLEDTERIKYVESTLKVMKQLVESNPSQYLNAISFVSTKEPEKIVQRSKIVLFPPQKINRSFKNSFISAILVLVTISYIFIVQPTAPPPRYPNEEYISIDPENSYLCPNEDGTYELYVDGQVFDTINSSELNVKPYSNLPIKNKEDPK